jgi:predicted nucleotidyltransferase
MFEKLLEELALALDRRQIPYMLIGGQAVLLYGEPRLTADIDITLGRDAEQVGEVLSLVKDLGWKVLVDKPEVFTRQTMVLPCQDPTSGIRLDFIFSFSPYEKQALERVRKVPMGQAQVRYASVEDIIIHKIIAGRPRDVEDVKSLLTKNPQIDPHYIRQWLGQFEQALSKPFLEQFKNLQKPS